MLCTGSTRFFGELHLKQWKRSSWKKCLNPKLPLVKMLGCFRKNVATSIVEALWVPDNLTYSTRAKEWRTKGMRGCHFKIIRCMPLLCVKQCLTCEKKLFCGVLQHFNESELSLRVFKMLILLLSPFLNSLSFSHVCVLVCCCLLLCCVNSGEDLERNDGSTAKPYFMSASLHRILGKKELSPKKAIG